MRHFLVATAFLAVVSNAYAIDQHDLDAYIVRHGGSTLYPELPPAQPPPRRPAPERVRVTAYGVSRLVTVGQSASSVVADESIQTHCHRFAQRTHGGYSEEQTCIDRENEAREDLKGNRFPANE